jgi:mono/diheme cytochrome c family protein
MAFPHIKTASAVALALMMASAAAAEEADGKNSGAPAEAAQVERGRRIYSDRCSHCHGLNMVTGGNVTYDLREFPRNQQERFFESVTNGKNNRMPPWGDVLTQEEIGDVWAYVLSRSKS